MNRSRKRRVAALVAAAFVVVALLLGTYWWTLVSTPPRQKFKTLVYQVWINTNSTGLNFSVVLPLPDKQEMWTMLYRVDAQSPRFDSAASVNFQHEATSKGQMLRVTTNGNVTLRAQVAYPEANTSTSLSFTTQESGLVWAEVPLGPAVRVQTIVLYAGQVKTAFDWTHWEYSGLAKAGIADEVYRSSYGGLVDDLLSRNAPLPLEFEWKQYQLSSGYFRTSLDI